MIFKFVQECSSDRFLRVLKDHELSGIVEVKYLAEDYPVIVVSNKHAKATVALHGAHVIDYTPAGECPVLFTSNEAIYREGKAIRGGIPVCWPWFGDAFDPFHGVARNAFWELSKSSHDEERTILVFEFSTDQLKAQLTVKIGAELDLSLQTTNLAKNSVRVGGALHTYFAISRIEDVSIHGLEERDYYDALSSEIRASEGRVIQIGEETDRVYRHTKDTVCVIDKGWNRTITVSKSGSESTVVWNPWIKKSASMADLANDDYLQFVCVETANAREDVYTLAPREVHCLAAQISTRPL